MPNRIHQKTTVLASTALAVILFLARPGGLRGAEEVKLSFDHFYAHVELTEALRALEKAYPKLMSVTSIGKSFEGRDLWGVILNNPETGPAEGKPGYYIDGNIHGNEIQGTEVALYAVYYLLKNYGRTEFATRLLDQKSFYIVPTMNPDSRDYFLLKAVDSNSPRGGLVPVDDDRDGRADEDGPDDLDGNGSITMMRKRDPYGNMKQHPEDLRILVPVKPGEKGEYVMLGTEGIDNDGDGMINEDGPGGYDMNRNFGYNWQPNYVQRGAGDYPFCWPETRAVRDFILAHPNIMGAQTFHNFGGMILRGPGAKNLGEYNPADIRVYDRIGKDGEKIIPGYRYITVYKDMYTVYGGTIDFFYNTLGIFTFSNELDFDQSQGLPQAPKRRSSSEDEEEDEEDPSPQGFFGADGLEEMFYHDHVLMGEHYADWKPYKHPLYGDIEIGGAKKFGSRVPALFRLAETCHRNAAFCLYHADQMPRLNFERVTVKKVGDDLSQVDLKIRNSGGIPSLSAWAVQKKVHRADRISVEGKARILASGSLLDEYRDLIRDIKSQGNFFLAEGGVPGFGTVDFRLLIKGSGEVEIVYDSLKGGKISKTVRLE